MCGLFTLLCIDVDAEAVDCLQNKESVQNDVKYGHQDSVH